LNNRYDVIVVGAGPAGSHAACMLADSGARVALLEKSSFPREKTCGGLLSEKSLRLLGEWRDELPSSQAIHCLKLYSRDMEFVEFNSPVRLGKTILRERFDQFLVDKCISKGVNFHDSTPIVDIIQDNSNVTVISKGTRFTAPFLIAADGALSRTSSLLGIRPIGFNFKMGFACSLIMQTAPGFIDDSTVELFFIPFIGGFGWCFPLPGDFINIGVGASCFALKHLYPYFQTFISRVFEDKGVLPPKNQIRPRGAFIPAGGFRRAIGINRVLLAGDAAGGVDAFSGEGIYHALLSGEQAASAVYEGLCKPSLKPVELYTSLYDQAFSRERRRSLALAILSLHKGQGFFRLFKENPKLIEWLGNIMLSQYAYSKLRLKDLFHRQRLTGGIWNS